jgi:hypothetical protein
MYTGSLENIVHVADTEELTTLMERLVLETRDPKLDLSKFLEDEFLRAEPRDNQARPVELMEGCRSARGATGGAWQS